MPVIILAWSETRKTATLAVPEVRGDIFSHGLADALPDRRANRRSALDVRFRWVAGEEHDDPRALPGYVTGGSTGRDEL